MVAHDGGVQIPCLVRMSRAALQEGKCVVIGLQSTGEARTADIVAEKGEILDDYVSGPRVRHACCPFPLRDSLHHRLSELHERMTLLPWLAHVICLLVAG